MATFHELSTAQLRQALQLREQIETLQKKLSGLLGGTGAAPAVKTKSAPATTKRRRTMSAEARAKIGAAQQARWAKVRGKSTAKAAKPAKSAAPAKSAVKPARKKGSLSPEGRARIAAATKARWEAKRKADAASAASA